MSASRPCRSSSLECELPWAQQKRSVLRVRMVRCVSDTERKSHCQAGFVGIAAAENCSWPRVSDIGTVERDGILCDSPAELACSWWPHGRVSPPLFQGHQAELRGVSSPLAGESADKWFTHDMAPCGEFPSEFLGRAGNSRNFLHLPSGLATHASISHARRWHYCK